MKKTGIINSAISKVLSDLGHTDRIVIADAGLPVPAGVPKIDLAVTVGNPSFEAVVKAVHGDMVVEKVFAAEEIVAENAKQHAFLTSEFPDQISYVPHEEFKQMTRQAKAVIRTGEDTPYSNCILQAGVFF
jgi:D-ribose pyranase